MFLVLGVTGCVSDDAQPPAKPTASVDAGTSGGMDGAVPPVDASAATEAGVDAGPTCDPSVISLWHGDGTTVDSLARNALAWSLPTQEGYVPSRFGKAFDFSSTILSPAASVSAPKGAGFPSGLTELTLSVWADPYTPGRASTGNLITIAPSPASAGTRIGLGLGPSGNSTDTIVQMYANGDFRAPAGTQKANVLDEWTHYVVTMKNDAQNLSLAFYVNGILKDNASVSGTLPPMGEPEIRLGGALSAYTYRAKIDEVAVYRRALSNPEVAALYTSGKPAGCP